ncbi:hypothetical protein HZC30_05035 [Candidatus Woesearchaeota archaeon]|nr:hypothetical protein [Candidatus Woesearchaeota archaeon]
MKKIGWMHRLENFELHHKVLAFVGVMLLTILLTRIGVNFHNPNPVLLNFELHHFDYGLLLLLVTCLLLLFGKHKYLLYLLLAGISFGLIIDDIWFIRENINDPGINEVQVYNDTFPAVVVLSIGVVLIALVINHFRKRPTQKLSPVSR